MRASNQRAQRHPGSTSLNYRGQPHYRRGRIWRRSIGATFVAALVFAVTQCWLCVAGWGAFAVVLAQIETFAESRLAKLFDRKETLIG